MIIFAKLRVLEPGTEVEKDVGFEKQLGRMKLLMPTRRILRMSRKRRSLRGRR